jgi:hypothetical protein
VSTIKSNRNLCKHSRKLKASSYEHKAKRNKSADYKPLFRRPSRTALFRRFICSYEKKNCLRTFSTKQSMHYQKVITYKMFDHTLERSSSWQLKDLVCQKSIELARL